MLGPPVADSSGVVFVMQHVNMAFTGKPCHLEQVEGPVPYDASWVPGGRPPLRIGMQAVELWTGKLQWSEYTPESFTVVVMDHEYLSNREAGHDPTADHQSPVPPRFETFIVIVLPNPEQRGLCYDEQRSVDSVYEWRTYPFWGWWNRATWTREPGGYSDPRRSITSVSYTHLTLPTKA